MTIADPCPCLSHEPLVGFPQLRNFIPGAQITCGQGLGCEKYYLDAKSQALNDSNLNNFEK